MLHSFTTLACVQCFENVSGACKLWNDFGSFQLCSVFVHSFRFSESFKTIGACLVFLSLFQDFGASKLSFNVFEDYVRFLKSLEVLKV